MRFSLQNKILLGGILLVTLPLTVCGFYVGHKTSGSIERETRIQARRVGRRNCTFH